MKRCLVPCFLLSIGTIALLFTLSRRENSALDAMHPEGQATEMTKAFIASRLSELRFVENRGQFPPSDLFSMRYADGTVSFGKGSVIVNTRRSVSDNARPTDNAVRPVRFGSRKGAVPADLPERSELVIDRLVIDFPGSRSDCEPEGLDERTERSSYFVGSDPDRWRSDVRTYDRLIYRELYPGIDLIYGESDNALKTDFIVRPGADPGSIKIRYSDSDNIWLDSDGSLVVRYGQNIHIESKPVAFQMIRGRKYLREAAYRILPGNLITYEIGDYTAEEMLVIDPTYCTLIGGSGIDAVGSVVQSATSRLYVAGRTFSSDFTVYGKPFQSDPAGASDGFIAIIDFSSGTITNTTFYGGQDDEAMHITLDAAGRIIAVGTTRSGDLPMAGNSFQPSLAGSMDIFVAVFDSTCSRLLHATYLGGSGFDDDFGMTLSPDGDILVTGLTDSRNFPTTSGAFQRTYKGGEDDVFVTRVSSDCSRLIFSTFIGGSSYDEGYGVALDGDENVYITGYTDSPNFPVTSNAIQRTKNPYDEGFIAKLDPTGSTLLYGTYFGGDVYDLVENVCIDPSGDIFVLGRTTSNDLPVTNGAYQASKGDSLNPNPYLSDLFVLRLSTDMTRILACT